MDTLYSLGEVIEKMEFSQIAIKVKGDNTNPNYKKVGTAIFFDEHDSGALKFIHNGADVVVCKGKDVEGDRWIILDK